MGGAKKKFLCSFSIPKNKFLFHTNVHSSNKSSPVTFCFLSLDPVLNAPEFAFCIIDTAKTAKFAQNYLAVRITRASYTRVHA